MMKTKKMIIYVLFVLGHIEAVEMIREKMSEVDCPRGCRCSSSNVLNCTGSNLTQPPLPIEDSTASDLLLASNRIPQIDFVFLKHFPSLRLLSLESNGLR